MSNTAENSLNIMQEDFQNMQNYSNFPQSIWFDYVELKNKNITNADTGGNKVSLL